MSVQKFFYRVIIHTYINTGLENGGIDITFGRTILEKTAEDMQVPGLNTFRGNSS